MTKRTRGSSRLQSLNGGIPGDNSSNGNDIFSNDDEDDANFHSRRSRKRVSYNEDDETAVEESDEDQFPSVEGEQEKEPEAEFGDEDDDPLATASTEEEKDDPNEEDYVEEDNISISRRRRNKDTSRRTKRSSQVKIDGQSDDEEFQDDDDDATDPDDEFLELTEKKFVATDDEDEGEDFGYGSRPKKPTRKPRSRSRSAEPIRGRGRLTRSQASIEPEKKVEEEDEEEEEDSIRKEVAELYDSSPEPSPMKHKLRERGKIDYTLPPPIINEAQFDSMNPNPIAPSFARGRSRKAFNKSEYRKILFPTAGPFGGSDVLSLFGTNIPPGGIPIPGLTNDNNLTAIGQNVSDSDSSEDEIAPVNGLATISKKAKNILSNISQPSASANGGSAPTSNSLLVTGGSSNDKDKKKSNLSDTDPLGIDMNIDFSVVGGLDNYINQLKEMVALPLLYPELYQNFSITPPRGVLFHGPPGTGKTLMARALAASCSTSTRKITFFMRKGADCLSKWVGEAERQLRLLFEEAKNQQPSIIFFDEIDGLAPVRSSKQEQIHASIVSTLLALMDGMDNRGQVIVIGATNRPDSVDPALRRPGRFDREFYFPLPDINARSEILEIHTRKWSPPLPNGFLDKVANLTKGYGGADLRALCTEAALNSIQRKYPQIYQTNDKLQVDPTKVRVVAKDFMNAIDKIIPSSARSTSSSLSPLPDHLKPLLEGPFNEATNKLSDLLPNSITIGKKRKHTALDEALYLDPTIKDEDGGFSKQELLRNLENSRICKPHLLICGDQGYGQQYISAAILNYLEGFQVQSLDLGNVFGDSTRTPELSIIQTFIEAKRHQPSIIFIPNIDIWFQVMPFSAKATLTGLLRNLKSTEKVLLLGVSETNVDDLDSEVRIMFGFNNEANNVILSPPHKKARQVFFANLEKTLKMKPFEFVNDLENRPKRKLKKLKVVPAQIMDEKTTSKKQMKEQEYKDTKLKNILKIKLAGLMDLFKNRYKRFKKPIIDENLLYHLFEPAVLDNPLNNYEVLYTKSDDPKHANMIKELSTGKYYFNMDLDIIEERLWNGFYSEAKQFLRDIRLIVKDAITSGDRERILKANEMLTNTQFGIDDFNNAEFAAACKDLRERELKKQEKILEDHTRLQKEFTQRQSENLDIINVPSQSSNMNGTSDDFSQVRTDFKPSPIDASNEVHTKQANITEQVVAPIVEISQPKSIEIFHNEEAYSGVIENSASIGDIEVGKRIVDEKPKDFPNAKNEAYKPFDTANDHTDIEPIESESEAEEEIALDLTRELVFDISPDKFFNEILLDLTEGYSVEKLEIVMAKFMDIVWSDRGIWDKSGTVKKLYEVADSLKSTLS